MESDGDFDLSVLAARLRRLRSARSGVAVLLHGPPGIGKSFTAQRLAHGSGVVHTTVEANVGWERLLQVVSASEKDDSRPAAFPASQALQLLQRLNRNAPLILVVEDLHEAQPERVALWTELAAMVQRSRGVGLLLTSRAPHPGLPRLELLPLTEEEEASLLITLAGGPLPDMALRWLRRRGAGNPLYLSEFFRWLRGHGSLWHDGQSWRWRTPDAEVLPGTLAALIRQQIWNVSADAKTRAWLLSWALCPGPLPTELRMNIAGLTAEDVPAAAALPMASGLLGEDGFTHPLFREVTLSDFPALERREMARQAIRHLEPVQATTLLSWAELSPRQGAALLLRAARRRHAQGARTEAARLKVQAARLGVAAGRDWPVALVLSALAQLRFADVSLARETAAWLLTVAPHDAEVVMMVADLYFAAGQSGDAEALLSRLPPGVQRDDWILRRLEMLQHAPDAPKLLQLWAERPDLHSRAGPLLCQRVAAAQVNTGQFEEAQAFVQMCLNRTGLSSLNRDHLRYIRGRLSWLRGEYEQAREELGEVLTRLSHDIGEEAQVLAAQVMWVQGGVLWGLSRHAEARLLMEEASRRFELQGDTLLHLQVQGLLGALLLELGEFQQAEQVLLSTRETSQSVGRLDLFALACANLGQLYVEWLPPFGPALAHRYAAEALRAMRDLNLPPILTQVLFLRAWVEAKHGDAARASELAEECMLLARQIGQQRSIAFAHLAQGMALEARGERRAAGTSLAFACDLLEALHLRTWTERFRLEIDRLEGQRVRAERRRATFLSWGAKYGLHLLDRYFPPTTRGGEHPVPVSDRSSLTLMVLGRFEVHFHGTQMKFQGHRARMLLVRLLEAKLSGGGEEGVPALIDALYPGVPERSAVTRLHALVYRVRSALGTGSVLTTADGYRLGKMTSDAEAFLEDGQGHHWRGPYLAGLTSDAERLAGRSGTSVRDHLVAALMRASQSLLPIAPLEAARLARIAVIEEPFEHAPVRLYLAALKEVGQTRQAARFYKTVQRSWQDVGERLPVSWQVYLQDGELGPQAIQV